MILKKSVLVVIIVWINGIYGTSYSKVYVNSGSNGPYQYVGYGAPAVAYSAPIAQLSAAPVDSVVPYNQAASFIPPCISPCIPQPPVSPVVKGGLVAYTAPRAPVVVAKDIPSNYEYSYVVYDDGTGDQKAARELSEGGIVRGQYSFLQPDGYVREVQYTADDVTGFNAIINYIPGGGERTVEVKESKPCPDVKSEALKQTAESKPESSAESGESTKTSVSGEEAVKDISSGEKTSEESSTEVPAPEAPKESSSSETPPETLVDKMVSKEEGSKSEESKEEGGKTKETKKEGSKEETPNEASASEEKAKAEDSKETKTSGEVLSTEKTEDKSHSKDTAEEHAVVESVEASQLAPAIITNTFTPGYVSYDQLLKCIQKMQNADLQINSPLTYILLPSSAKPC